MKRKFKLSGLVSPDSYMHLLKEQAIEGSLIPPDYINIQGVGYVPQYASTIYGRFMGYNPPDDCDGYFMSSKYMAHNNCYAYGCIIASNSFPQPGRKKAYVLPDNFSGADVVKGAEMDGLIKIGNSFEQLKAFIPPAGIKGHFVALLISHADPEYGWPGDFHWVRCDDGLTFLSWSHKYGEDHVVNYDFAGNMITDPQTANWNFNQGPASEENPDELMISYDFYAYMFVPGRGVDII